MDLNRFYRALLAGQMARVEQRRQMMLKGKIKGKDIDQEDWAIILTMDELE